MPEFIRVKKLDASFDPHVIFCRTHQKGCSARGAARVVEGTQAGIPGDIHCAVAIEGLRTVMGVVTLPPDREVGRG